MSGYYQVEKSFAAEDGLRIRLGKRTGVFASIFMMAAGTCCAGFLHFENLPIVGHPGGNGELPHGTHAVLPFEMRPDGLTDYVVAAPSTVTFYENQSSPSEPRAKKLGVMAYAGPTTVAMGDLDGDGMQDVIVANHDHTRELTWLRRKAEPTETSLYSYEWARIFAGWTNPALGPAYPVTADLDNDGDLDVIVSFRDTTEYFRNDRGSFARVLISSYGYGYYPDDHGRKQVVDFNNDGRLDIVVGDRTAYRNDGGSPPSFTRLTSFPYGLPADINGDGRMDLVAQGPWFRAEEGIWYRNEGGDPPTFTSHHYGGAPYAGNPAQIVDLDRDGDPDIISGSGGLLFWFENTGGASPSLIRRIIAETPYRTAGVFDLDGDRRPDVLTAHGNFFRNAPVIRLRSPFFEGSQTTSGAGARGGSGRLTMRVDNTSDIPMTNVRVRVLHSSEAIEFSQEEFDATRVPERGSRVITLPYRVRETASCNEPVSATVQLHWDGPSPNTVIGSATPSHVTRVISNTGSVEAMHPGGQSTMELFLDAPEDAVTITATFDLEIRYNLCDYVKLCLTTPDGVRHYVSSLGGQYEGGGYDGGWQCTRETVNYSKFLIPWCPVARGTYKLEIVGTHYYAADFRISVDYNEYTCPPAPVQEKIHDDFTTGSTNPGLSGWAPMTPYTDGVQGVEYSSTAGAYLARVWAASSAGQIRSAGIYSLPSASLPWSQIPADHHVRGKFSVYRGGQSNMSAIDTIPLLQLRLANRFAVNSVLEVLHHANADPGNNPFAGELRPSWSPATPSLYRVDFAPVRVPFLDENAATEGITRGFAAYAPDPQDNGFLALTESSVGTYPVAEVPDTVPPSRVYAPSGADAGSLGLAGSAGFYAYNVIRNPDGSVGSRASDPAALLGTRSEGHFGVTLDTSAVPADRIGVALYEFDPGPSMTAPDYLRVEEGKQYKVRFHLRSTAASSDNAQIRMRVRSVKFAWVQKLEIGGARALGTMSHPNSIIASQALPGIGCLNPDQRTPGEAGGWYTVLVNSPLSRDIRPEFTGPIAERMPRLAGAPGPGQEGRSPRDLRVALDLIDSFSPGPNYHREKGNVTVDRIEVRTYPAVAD